MDESEWLASRPGRFNPGERAPGIHWIWGWLGPAAGLDAVKKVKISCMCQNRMVQRMACPYIDWAISASYLKIHTKNVFRLLSNVGFMENKNGLTSRRVWTAKSWKKWFKQNFIEIRRRTQNILFVLNKYNTRILFLLFKSHIAAIICLNKDLLQTKALTIYARLNIV
jgi:hypothetical protein